MDIVEKLLSRIKVNANGCFEWQGALNNRGYGQIKINKSVKKVHRLSFEVFRKRIPPGTFVLHRCDNPLCLNPSHLFLGSALDNARDAKSKRRHTHGARIAGAKLSDNLVQEIRRCFRSGESKVSLSLRFGVTPTTIANAIKQKNWSHVG